MSIGIFAEQISSAYDGVWNLKKIATEELDRPGLPLSIGPTASEIRIGESQSATPGTEAGAPIRFNDWGYSQIYDTLDGTPHFEIYGIEALDAGKRGVSLYIEGGKQLQGQPSGTTVGTPGHVYITSGYDATGQSNFHGPCNWFDGGYSRSQTAVMKGGTLALVGGFCQGAVAGAKGGPVWVRGGVINSPTAICEGGDVLIDSGFQYDPSAAPYLNQRNPGKILIGTGADPSAHGSLEWFDTWEGGPMLPPAEIRIGETGVDVHVGNHAASLIGFYGAAPIVKPSVTGAQAGASAVALSVLSALANFGLVTDSTT